MDLSTGEPVGPAPAALPPPPPPAPPRGAAAEGRPVAGQLTPGWRVTTGLVWAMVFVAMIAVWKTSRELGLSTWWLGPLGEPAPWFVTLLPFVPPAAMVVLTMNNAVWMPWGGLAAAGALGAIGAADLGRVPRLGVVELAIAGAGALVAVAGFAGRYGTPSSSVPPP